MHQPITERFNKAPIIFLTVCTRNRKRILANSEVVVLLRDSWHQATSWTVGRFIVMPDHLHLFCAPMENITRPLSQWVRYWKTVAFPPLAAPAGTAGLAIGFLGHATPAWECITTRNGNMSGRIRFEPGSWQSLMTGRIGVRCTRCVCRPQRKSGAVRGSDGALPSKVDALFRALAENEFGQRQICRIGDLEILLAVRHENHLTLDPLDCRNLVGHFEAFAKDHPIRCLEEVTTENLWGLHREKTRARNATNDDVIAIDAFEGVDNRRGARRPAVYARQLENTLDQIRPDERTGGVMDGNEFGLGAELIQTTLHGILPARPTRNDSRYLPKTVRRDDRIVLGEALGLPHKDDSGDRLSLLEGGEGMGQDRLAIERGEEFVETHSLAAAASNDDGSEHEIR